MNTTKLTFEDCIDVINSEISKRSDRWTLTSIQWIDYSDIAQILRIHIYKKWGLWDQSRPLRPWLHTTIVNQIINLIRNHYKSYSRPCLSCSASEGGDLCSIYKTQNNNCPIYALWARTKKNAHDIKLPVPLEYHINEISELPQSHVNLEKGIKAVHEQMKIVLKPAEYVVYKYLYIDEKDEEQLGKFLGLKTIEKNRKNGYKQIDNIKNIIFKKANELIYGEGVDF